MPSFDSLIFRGFRPIRTKSARIFKAGQVQRGGSCIYLVPCFGGVCDSFWCILGGLEDRLLPSIVLNLILDWMHLCAVRGVCCMRAPLYRVIVSIGVG